MGLTTQLALMANKGIAGSDAGTSLKTMMASLIPQTDEQANLMRKLGIDVFDAQGKFVGVRKAIQVYGRGLKGLSQEEKTRAVNTLFGSDASRAANIVLLGGVKAYDKTRRAVSKAGSAQKLADAQTKGFKGSLDAFKSTLESTGITFGTVLLPAATAAMGFLTGAFGALEGHKTATLVVVGALGALSVAVLTVNLGVKAYRSTMAAATVVNALAAGGFWRLNAAIAANPIGMAVAALALLAVGLVYAYKKSETFRGAVHAVWGALKSGFGWVKKNWPTLAGILTGGIVPAIRLVIKNFDAIKGAAKGAINAVISMFNAGIGLINAVTPGKISMPGPLPDFAGIPDIPKIPMLASGGVIARGGAALVGDKPAGRGGEIVTLPTGARVHDTRTSAAMLSGGGSMAALVAALERQTAAIRALAARPHITQINGREIARSNAQQLATESAFS